MNKTDSRITVRWNIQDTNALSDEQKTRILAKLDGQLASGGNLFVHSDTAHCQLQNKAKAFERLAKIIRKALHVTRKRIDTKILQAA